MPDTVNIVSAADDFSSATKCAKRDEENKATEQISLRVLRGVEKTDSARGPNPAKSDVRILLHWGLVFTEPH